MEPVCITGRYLGHDRNLIVDDAGYRWSDDVPREMWVLDSEGYWPAYDVASLLALAAVDVSYPDEPSRIMATTCGIDPDGPVQWAKMLPIWKLRELTRDLLDDVQSVLKSEDRDYYVETWDHSRRLLSSLKPAKVDVDKLTAYIESDMGNVAALKSFAPDSCGFASVPRYDLLGGRTGRMKVVDGPQILTLLTKHRDVITSRWEGGQIVLLDYTSLEARIAAFEAGHTPPVDIYTELGNSVLGGAPRSTAKLTVLSTLFGAGAAMLEDHVEPGTAEWLVEKLHEHFDIERVTRRLRQQHMLLDGYIRNRYGRLIKSRRASHILYNSYIQSTGVDVALSGFRRVVDAMKDKALLSSPIFFLHDACIIDFHPDELLYIDELCAVGSNIDRYEHAFPLRAKGLLE